MPGFIFISLAGHGQEKSWRYEGQFNFGCNVLLAFSKAQKLAGLRAYIAFSATAYRGDFMASYGPSLSLYTKTIGANLNPLVGDWQLDLTNTFSGGVVWGGQNTYNTYMRTFHNGDYYNLVTNRQGAAVLSTNFILNNHRRNQIIGSVNVLFDNVSLNYYNDGPPFDLIALGDNFDRYWTGGGSITLHTRKNYNTAELSFDQFTGYVPLLYELSGILGLNVPLYDDPGQKRAYNFNTSAYHLRINTDQNFGLNVGVMGSLTHKGRYYGIQDIIHMLGHFSLHPNNDNNRIFIGGSYSNFQNVKF